MISKRNLIDFRMISGPCLTAQENFQELCSQFIMRKYPDAKPVEGRGGDHGIDTYLGSSPSHSKAIFQVKYFLEPLKSAQKRQIEDSFKRIASNESTDKWILCIPRNLTYKEQEWFYKINERNTQPEGPSLELDWIGETELRDFLYTNPSIAFFYFPDLENTPPENSLMIHDFSSSSRDILFKLTNLSDNLIIVNSIKLEVLKWGPFEMPPRFEARIETYKYHVKLTPGKLGEVLLNDGEFKYYKGDIDQFKIECSSSPCNRYLVKINFYCNDVKTNIHFKAETPIAELDYFDFSKPPLVFARRQITSNRFKVWSEFIGYYLSKPFRK